MIQNDPVRTLFDEVVTRPRAEWEALLSQAVAVGTPGQVVEDVRELLAHADSTSHNHTRSADEKNRATRRVAFERLLDGGLPESIGTYRIEERVGEGEFGVVFRATQTSGVVRTVAVKVLKTGLLSPDRVRRFEREQRALAVMNHPNIASVLDAGVDNGFPYLVMEYVEGSAVTTYCDQTRLSIHQRLELFMHICEGVQHAHTKGIIHRDLSPRNILAFEQGGRVTAKIIDFGLSTVTEDLDEVDPGMTQARGGFGTPPYTSPEQLLGGNLRADTRSDVYSLGMILYELIAGMTPIDGASIRKGTPVEWARLFEAVPPPPSRLLSSLSAETLESIANARATLRHQLTRQLGSELGWIPLKAVRADREQRYASAMAIADDLRRYLNNEPLQAGPESRWYRTRKFVRRNRLGVSVAAVIVMVIGFGAWGTLRGQRIADRERVAVDRAVSVLGRVVHHAMARERASGPTAASETNVDATPLLREVLANTLDDFDLASESDRRALTTVFAAAFPSLERGADLGIDLRRAIHERLSAVLGPTHIDTIDAEIRLLRAEWNLAMRRGRLPEQAEIHSHIAETLDSLARHVSSRDRRLWHARLAYDDTLPSTTSNNDDAVRRALLSERTSRHPFAEADPIDRVELMMAVADALPKGDSTRESWYRLAAETAARTLGANHVTTFNAERGVIRFVGDMDGRKDEVLPLALTTLARARHTLGDTHYMIGALVADVMHAGFAETPGNSDEALALARLGYVSEKANQDNGLARTPAAFQWYANRLAAAGRDQESAEVAWEGTLLARRFGALAESWPLVLEGLRARERWARDNNDAGALEQTQSIWLEAIADARARERPSTDCSFTINFAFSIIEHDRAASLPLCVSTCTAWLDHYRGSSALPQFAWSVLTVRGLALAKLGRRDEAARDLATAESLIDTIGGIPPGRGWLRDNFTVRLAENIGDAGAAARWRSKPLLAK